MQPADADLIRACLAGEEAGWRTLVLRYERLIYSIPMRLGMAPEEADDVFQNVCLALLRNLDGLRNPERLAPWLIVTTRRECWARWRRTQHEVQTDADVAGPDSEDPEAIVDADEELRAVLAALERLPERCRRLLRRLYLEGTPPTYQQLADELDMPVNSLGPTRARCLGRLSALLGG
jgi:RNA polymerase sigma factor (sigma-70 family)